MHVWQEDHSAPFHHHRNTPWWKCLKCGTSVQTWDKPSDDMKVHPYPGFRDNYTCEEYLAFQVMEA